MITIKRVFTYTFDNEAYRRKLEKLTGPQKNKLLNILTAFEQQNIIQANTWINELDHKEQLHLDHTMWMTIQQHQDVKPQYNQLFYMEQ